jgi:hypothetical protein
MPFGLARLFQRSHDSVAEPYAESWREFRWRLILPGLLIFIFAVVLPYPAHLMLKVGLPVLVPMSLFLVVMLGFLISYYRLWFFPCPRCGRLFRKLTEWYPHRCQHCGLRKWATSDQEDGKVSGVWHSG